MRQEKTAEPAAAIEPAYYEVGYWKRWSRVYDSLVKLFFLPFGGELRFRDNFVDFASSGRVSRYWMPAAAPGQ